MSNCYKQFVSYPYSTHLYLQDEENDITHHEVYSICTNEAKIYWQGAQYIYKGLLLAFGTFLAWETRNIDVPALNDSKLIGFCVYNIVIICFVGVPINHLLREDQITARFVLRNCFVIFCTTLALCILFLPKVMFSIITPYLRILDFDWLIFGVFFVYFHIQDYFRSFLLLPGYMREDLTFFPLCRGICENIFHLFTLAFLKPPNSFGIFLLYLYT